MRNYIEEIASIIENFDTESLVSAHNQYCKEAGSMDDYIYSMDEFDEILEHMTPWEVARAAYYSGKFCPAHDYFWFNAYGNLESDDYKPSIIYPSEIADYCVRYDDDLGDGEIREILDEMNESEAS